MEFNVDSTQAEGRECTNFCSPRGPPTPSMTKGPHFAAIFYLPTWQLKNPVREIFYRQGIMAALRYDNEIFQMYYAPVPQEVERGLPRPLQPNRLFDHDRVVPHPVAWPHESCVDLVNAAEDEFEVDDASAGFFTWRAQEAGGNDNRLVSDARMTNGRAARLLDRLKALRIRGQGDWFIQVEMVPIREEARRKQEIVTIIRDTRPGALTGIDRVYYQNT